MTNTNWNADDTITIDTTADEDITFDAGTLYNGSSTIDISSITTDNIRTITLEDTQFMWEQKELLKLLDLDGSTD